MTEEKLAKILRSLLAYNMRIRVEPRLGCAMNRLLTTNVLFQTHASSCGIYAGKLTVGQILLRGLRPSPLSIIPAML